MEYLALILLAGLFAYREYNNSKERNDLLDRLMSRSYKEFKTDLKHEDNDFENKDDDTIPIGEAKDLIDGQEEG